MVVVPPGCDDDDDEERKKKSPPVMLRVMKGTTESTSSPRRTAFHLNDFFLFKAQCERPFVLTKGFRCGECLV